MSGFQPEIQGMRALSVLAVVWAHAGFAGLPGGFTGVDVFFVISGFLITRLLLAEMESTGRIDLPAFWVRRARRLLPNAFAALFGTVLLALFLFPGYSPGKLAQEITYAALNLANFRFADDAVDYFQSEGAASPILHFWSLSVEEQFYMVWPPVLLGLGLFFRRPLLRSAAIFLGLTWCVSFAASLYLTHAEQPFAYFGTGTRCWQLATGALVAVGWQTIARLPQGARAAMAWLGLAAILASMVMIEDGALYPGAFALLPTLGAAALIAGFGAADPRGLLRRALSAPVMQWIGERSYSWYLWHWPLLALPRTVYGDSPLVPLIALPASLAIAWAAHAWIETPIRKGRVLPAGPRPALAGALAGLAIVIAAGHLYGPAVFFRGGDLADRILAVEAASKDLPSAYADGCHLSYRWTDQPDCAYGDAAAARDVVLFGDSHAGHWFEGLHRASSQAGWTMRSWTKSSCPSIDVPTLRGDSLYDACALWREKIMAKLTGPGRPDLVVLSNRTAFYEQRTYDPVSGQRLAREDARRAIMAGWRAIVERLLAAGVEVAIIRDTPHAANNFRGCFIAGRSGCAVSREQALRHRDAEDTIAREFADRVKMFDFADAICTGADCPLVKNGIIVYRDQHHLTARFSASLAPQLVGMLQAFPEKRDPVAPDRLMTSTFGIGETAAAQ